MKPGIGRRPIPLEQRIQPAKVHKRGVAALELIMEPCRWAKRARVESKELPEGRSVHDYAEGERIEVFLHHPITDADYYHASLRWGDRKVNPWFSRPPKRGDLVEAEAVQYLANYKGVFVRLADSAIDALLRISEVPGGGDDIRDAIDIGDRLVVEVAEVRTDLLEVDVSVNQALKSLAAREQRRRLVEEFGLATVRLVSRERWAQPRRTGMRVGVLGPDVYFANHLVLWLEALGISTIRLNDVAHLERVLVAHNRPTHLLCPKEMWPVATGGKPLALRRAIDDNGVRVLWLHTAASRAVPPFDGPTLGLPLRLDDLIRTLEDPDHKPSERRGNEVHLYEEFQGRHVQRIAERLLSDICERLKFRAALWVVRERQGVFTPRAWHQIPDAAVQALQPRLAQTLIAASIEQDEVVVWPSSKIGPLMALAPDDADRVLCLPVRFRPLDGGKPTTERAVAFFYNARAYRHEPADPAQHPAAQALEPYLQAMEVLVHTLHFARHNETLAAFADLGRNAASYLHELGQKTLPVQEFLDHHREAGTVRAEDWRNLQRQLGELIAMARGDLGRVRRRHGERLQLRERLMRLAQLNFFRFNTADCAFLVELPDLPLLLCINPLVVDQAISNLLDNALHFAGKRPGFGRVSVRVRLDPEGDCSRPLVIEVEDNGSGVRATMEPLLFEARHSGKEQGTGMGLFIARGFVRGLGGELRLTESVRWLRTRFEVRLPVTLDIGAGK